MGKEVRLRGIGLMVSRVKVGRVECEVVVVNQILIL